MLSAELAKTDLSGLTTKEDRYPDVYVWLPKWDSATLVHELFHAVGMMCRSAGIEDEETGAYLIGYLFKDLVWTENTKKKDEDGK